MRRIGPWFVIAALVVVASTLASAAAPPPPSVAVVDVMKLLDEHPRKKEVNDKLDQRQAEAQAYAKAENAKLEKLKGDILLMNSNDPGRRDKEQELARGLVMLKFEIEWRQKEAEREYNRGLEVLYGDVNRAVSQYAREQGIGLVLAKRDAQINAVDVNDWSIKVQLRTVVHSDAALDITDRVKAILLSTAQPPAPGGTAPGGTAPGTRPPPAPPVAPPSVPPGPPPSGTPKPPQIR